MTICENTLEQVIISELHQKGYNSLYGPDIDRDYHEVILKDYFGEAIHGINPGIDEGIIAETYRTIKDFGLLKLEDMNASFHKYLVEGVPVNYRMRGELRTYTVKLIDFENPEKNEFHVVNQYTVIGYEAVKNSVSMGKNLF